jgi:hypothetical protein
MANKKIDIFVAHSGGGNRYFSYAASTVQSKTCAEAKRKFYYANYPKIALTDIKTAFADRNTNPAPRKTPSQRSHVIKKGKRAGETTKTPDARLLRRREMNVEPGYFPNPAPPKQNVEFEIFTFNAIKKTKVNHTSKQLAQASLSFAQGLITAGQILGALTRAEAQLFLMQLKQDGVIGHG